MAERKTEKNNRSESNDSEKDDKHEKDYEKESTKVLTDELTTSGSNLGAIADKRDWIRVRRLQSK